MLLKPVYSTLKGIVILAALNIVKIIRRDKFAEFPTKFDDFFVTCPLLDEPIKVVLESPEEDMDIL